MPGIELQQDRCTYFSFDMENLSIMAFYLDVWV